MSLSHFSRLTLSPVLTLLKMPTIEHSEHSISPLTTTTLFTVLTLFRLVDALPRLESPPGHLSLEHAQRWPLQIMPQGHIIKTSSFQIVSFYSVIRLNDVFHRFLIV